MNPTPPPEHPEPWRALQRDDLNEVKWREQRGEFQDIDPAAPRRWLCRRCRAPITSESERLTIAGQHLHRRTNPYGVEFELGCFGAAPGATTTGLPTSEHTWFAAYRWSFALCRRCNVHLGWFFSGAEPPFHGLIFKLLIEESSSDRA